jgi:hypothetical protein
MEVFTHDRKAEHIHGKDPCQHLLRSSLPPSQTSSSSSLGVAQLLPLLAMQIVSASFFISPAQISPLHTAMHQMKHMNLVVRKDRNPIHSWHSRRSRQTQRVPANVAVHSTPVTCSFFDQVHGTRVCVCRVVVRSANKTDAGVQCFFRSRMNENKSLHSQRLDQSTAMRRVHSPRMSNLAQFLQRSDAYGCCHRNRIEIQNLANFVQSHTADGFQVVGY